MQNQKKTPLGGLVPKLPTKEPSNKMPLPSIPSPTKKPAKKTLFDDGEDDLAPVEKKVVEKKPAAKKQNLFDG